MRSTIKGATTHIRLKVDIHHPTVCGDNGILTTVQMVQRRPGRSRTLSLSDTQPPCASRPRLVFRSSAAILFQHTNQHCFSIHFITFQQKVISERLPLAATGTGSALGSRFPFPRLRLRPFPSGATWQLQPGRATEVGLGGQLIPDVSPSQSSNLCWGEYSRPKYPKKSQSAPASGSSASLQNRTFSYKIEHL